MLLSWVSILVLFQYCLASFDWTIGNTSVVLSANAYCDLSGILTHQFSGYASGFQALATFEESSYDTQGYIGVMDSQKTIYVIFRGSESITDWIDNLDVVLTTYPYCKDCEVHKGFYTTELAAYDLVLNTLLPIMSKYPSYQLVITGHSLGAAMATLFYMDLLEKQGLTNMKLMNFGSPRVGNDEWAEYASNKIVSKSRVTHHKDMVPHCPMHERFTHISGEYYQDDSGLKECTGYEDPTCSYQWTITSIEDHMWYLNIHMGCAW